MKLKKLTKAQIEKLLKMYEPIYSFNYSNDDWALAYEHREFKSAVSTFNYVLPALKYYKKTGKHDTWDKFSISIKKVLHTASYLDKIERGLI